MKTLETKGLFITFEGIDGCGKSTQMEKLYKYLIEKNYDVIKTYEPGNAPEIGKDIRNLLLHKNINLSKTAETFLFLADRSEHMDKLVIKNVNEGKIVLCDRHTDSTIAYQGYGRKENIDDLIFLNNMATSYIKPDLTFIFNIKLKTALNRIGKEADRMESSGIDFLEKVCEGYIKIAKNEPQRIKVIDANKPIDDVFCDVKKYMEDFFKLKRINQE